MAWGINCNGHIGSLLSKERNLASRLRPKGVTAQAFEPTISAKNRRRSRRRQLQLMSRIISTSSFRGGRSPTWRTIVRLRITRFRVRADTRQRRTTQIRINPATAEPMPTARRILSGVTSALFIARLQPGRAGREHQAFEHKQDSQTDEEVGERYGPHRTETSRFDTFLIESLSSRTAFRFGSSLKVLRLH